MKNKQEVDYPVGYYEMCMHGCPRAEDMHTKNPWDIKQKLGGPQGYWGI